MTLILGMSKPEGIYLSVDYRVTDLRTRKFIDDESIKNLTIHYPPLDNGGPKVMLGFTGLAYLPDKTPMLTWIRETLRGESEVINQSMAHLRARLNRDIAPLRSPLIINLLVLERYRRLFGAFTNQRVTGPGQITTTSTFKYVMTELREWTIFANGSGAQQMLKDGHFPRLEPHLGVVPREAMNHMKLLAVMNRRVASKDETVSPFCQVSFINASDRFQPISHVFTEKGESAPIEMPTLLAGIDTTLMMRNLMRNSQAFFKGEIDAMPEIDVEELNRELKRRP